MVAPDKPGAIPALDCRFYRTPAGVEPVRVWLRGGLAADVRQQIGWDLAAVQGRWPVGRPLVGAFGAGLFEVRTKVGKEQYRVLFSIVGREMVLLHGFHKKTRRTPAADIALARTRMKDEES
jgi:phage-related protein